MSVLVTVGTTRNDFSRLIAAVDDLVAAGHLGGCFGQTGGSRYRPAWFPSRRYLDRLDLARRIDASELVITHAGTGMVNMCLEARKKVIVFPRLKQYGEHPDDHQLELAEYLDERGRALVARDRRELLDRIQILDTWQPTFRTVTTTSIPALRMLHDFVAGERPVISIRKKGQDKLTCAG